MAQRVVRFSDLTNKIIEDDDVVRVVIENTRLSTMARCRSRPLGTRSSPSEKGALSVVRIKLYHGDGSEPEAVTMEIETFNELAGDTDMADVIHRAEPAYPPRRQVRSAPMSTGEKPDYATLEQAGKPHRGRTTDAEKEIVRNKFR